MQTNRERDNNGRFLADSQEMANKTKCPQCGKIMPVMDIRKTSFCGMVCESNYRYAQKHKDTLTGRVPSPSEVRKW